MRSQIPISVTYKTQSLGFQRRKRRQNVWMANICIDVSTYQRRRIPVWELPMPCASGIVNTEIWGEMAVYAPQGDGKVAGIFYSACRISHQSQRPHRKENYIPWALQKGFSVIPPSDTHWMLMRAPTAEEII